MLCVRKPRSGFGLWGCGAVGRHLNYALYFLVFVVVVVVVVVVAFKDARVVGLLATDSCLLGSRVLPPITGAA